MTFDGDFERLCVGMLSNDPEEQYWSQNSYFLVLSSDPLRVLLWHVENALKERPKTSRTTSLTLLRAHFRDGVLSSLGSEQISHFLDFLFFSFSKRAWNSSETQLISAGLASAYASLKETEIFETALNILAKYASDSASPFVLFLISSLCSDSPVLEEYFVSICENMINTYIDTTDTDLLMAMLYCYCFMPSLSDCNNNFVHLMTKTAAFDEIEIRRALSVVYLAFTRSNPLMKLHSTEIFDLCFTFLVDSAKSSGIKVLCSDIMVACCYCTPISYVQDLNAIITGYINSISEFVTEDGVDDTFDYLLDRLFNLFCIFAPVTMISALIFEVIEPFVSSDYQSHVSAALLSLDMLIAASPDMTFPYAMRIFEIAQQHISDMCPISRSSAIKLMGSAYSSFYEALKEIESIESIILSISFKIFNEASNDREKIESIKTFNSVICKAPYKLLTEFSQIWRTILNEETPDDSLPDAFEAALILYRIDTGNADSNILDMIPTLSLRYRNCLLRTIPLASGQDVDFLLSKCVSSKDEQFLVGLATSFPHRCRSDEVIDVLFGFAETPIASELVETDADLSLYEDYVFRRLSDKLIGYTRSNIDSRIQLLRSLQLVLMDFDHLRESWLSRVAVIAFSHIELFISTKLQSQSVNLLSVIKYVQDPAMLSTLVLRMAMFLNIKGISLVLHDILSQNERIQNSDQFFQLVEDHIRISISHLDYLSKELPCTAKEIFEEDFSILCDARILALFSRTIQTENPIVDVFTRSPSPDCVNLLITEGDRPGYTVALFLAASTLRDSALFDKARVLSIPCLDHFDNDDGPGCVVAVEAILNLLSLVILSGESTEEENNSFLSSLPLHNPILPFQNIKRALFYLASTQKATPHVIEVISSLLDENLITHVECALEIDEFSVPLSYPSFRKLSQFLL